MLAVPQEDAKNKNSLILHFFLLHFLMLNTFHLNDLFCEQGHRAAGREKEFF